MQKVRDQAFSIRNIALSLLVGTGFQILFHSPLRGSFHLSLTVLCAIGDMRVFSLGWWCTRIPTRRLRPRGTWDTTNCSSNFTYRAFTFFGLASQLVLLFFCSYIVVPQPRLNHFKRFRLFPVRSPLLGESRTWFIFLEVLRCFSSLGSLPNPTLLGLRIMSISTHGVAPFGHVRVNACLTALRTLSWSTPSFFASHVPRHPSRAFSRLSYLSIITKILVLKLRRL